MKTSLSILSFLLLFLFIIPSSQAQFIPNGEFETWSSSTGNFLPVGWKSQSIQTDPNSIKATAPGYNSAQALRISVTSSGGSYTHADLYQNLNIFERPVSLVGAIWGNAATDDSLFICVKLYNSGQFVGQAVYINTQYVVAFTPFEAYFTYSNNNNPDSAIIMIKNRVNSGMASTFHMVDGLNLTGITGLEDAESIASAAILPNPSNGICKLRINSIVQDDCVFCLMDLQGRIIDRNEVQILSGSNNIAINLQENPDGLYFYKLIGNKISIEGKIDLSR